MVAAPEDDDRIAANRMQKLHAFIRFRVPAGGPAGIKKQLDSPKHTAAEASGVCAAVHAISELDYGSNPTTSPT